MKQIIFSTENVKALLDGRKTMTRMPIKPQPEFTQVHVWDGKLLYDGENRTWCWKQHVSSDCWNEIDWLEQFAPYKPGDVMWVRETWKSHDYQFIDGMWNCAIVYKAGGMEGRVYWPDGTDIHMLKEAARIFLRVTDVRVEKLQDITLKDIEQEGLYCDPEYADPTRTGHYAYEPGMRIHFTKLWDSLNAKRGLGWDVNPWVWVIGFERIEKEEAGK